VPKGAASLTTRQGAAQPPVATVCAAAAGHKGEPTMGSKSDQIKGRIKEAVGVLADDDRLKREGQRDQAVGEVKETVEKAAEQVKEKMERAAEKVKEKAKRAVEKVKDA
jgi:uncharacterized protein YjbJ (UPF0337 family)